MKEFLVTQLIKSINTHSIDYFTLDSIRKELEYKDTFVEFYKNEFNMRYFAGSEAILHEVTKEDMLKIKEYLSQDDEEMF